LPGVDDPVDAVVRSWRDQPADDGGTYNVAREPLDATERTGYERQLAEFEQRYGLRLPAAFRALYLRSDGTGMMDANEIIFWPFDNIAFQLEVNAEAEPGRAVWLQFADFRLGARMFLLRLDRADDTSAGVHGLDAHPPAALPGGARPLAGSFEEFLRLYLADPTAVTGRILRRG
jgi:hypothetical protein